MLDRTLSKVVFTVAPALDGMDYKDHAAAWSARIVEALDAASVGVGLHGISPSALGDEVRILHLYARATELGLLGGYDTPRQFLRGIEFLRNVRSHERDGFRPIEGERV